MAANILNSERAVQMSIFVVRAFIKMRQTLATSKALMEKLHELEKKLTERLDAHERNRLRVGRTEEADGATTTACTEASAYWI